MTGRKCIWCGKEIAAYDSDPRHAEYERKWNIHWKCKEAIEDMLDRTTPGAPGPIRR